MQRYIVLCTDSDNGSFVCWDAKEKRVCKSPKLISKTSFAVSCLGTTLLVEILKNSEFMQSIEHSHLYLNINIAVILLVGIIWGAYHTYSCLKVLNNSFNSSKTPQEKIELNSKLLNDTSDYNKSRYLCILIYLVVTIILLCTTTFNFYDIFLDTAAVHLLAGNIFSCQIIERTKFLQENTAQ